MTAKIDLYGLDMEAMRELLAPLGGGPRVAARIFGALYHEQPDAIRSIQGVRPGLLERLEEVATLGALRLVRQVASDEPEPAVKLIVASGDGREFETVLIPARDRLTVCISSQIGCRMGCTFCQTGRMGLVRNLTAAEIVLQVVLARSRLDPGRRITNIVYMGMGEPVDNFDALWRSCLVLQEHRGLSIPRRRITISSAGYLPGLERLAAEGVPVNLALSLNASSDAVRSDIMPVNRAWPIEKLLEYAERFPLRPDRQVMLEYVLLEGVNDSPEDIERLVSLLAGRRVKVNVIAYNPIPGLTHKRPAPERVEAFAAALAERGVWTMVRESRGRDAMGACGQLGKPGRREVRR